MTEALSLDGKTIGVVGSELFVGSFEKDLYARKILATGNFAVLNDKGVFLFHPKAAGKDVTAVFGPEGKAFADKITASKEASGVMKINIGDKSQILGYKTLKNGWRMIAVTTMGDIYAPRDSLVAIMLIISVVALAALAVLSYLIGRSIAKPIAAVSALQTAIAAGDFTARIPVSYWAAGTRSARWPRPRRP